MKTIITLCIVSFLGFYPSIYTNAEPYSQEDADTYKNTKKELAIVRKSEDGPYPYYMTSFYFIELDSIVDIYLDIEEIGFYENFIINDTVLGISLGTTSLSYLSLSLFTSYIRTATLRSAMVTEWFTFIPALFFSNLVYLIIINNFSNVSFYYVELLQNTFFTFLFFPIFYQTFTFYQKMIKKD